jgi:nucleotide-binding universal stress UspA family protein
MPKKILCATDGTVHSETAVEFAAKLAKATDATLTYVSVAPYAVDRGGVWPLWRDKDATEKLDSAARVAEKLGSTSVHRIEIKARDVAGAILHCADKTEADLVVVGTRNRGPLPRLLGGSISNEVMNKSHIPVTVVR